MIVGNRDLRAGIYGLLNLLLLTVISVRGSMVLLELLDIRGTKKLLECRNKMGDRRSQHIVLYMLIRYVARHVITVIKLSICKSIILPVLLYGFSYSNHTDGSWLQTEFSDCRLLNILPLPMFFKAEKRRKNHVPNSAADRLELVNRIAKYANVTIQVNRCMWKFVNKRFDERNVCTWQLFCDCNLCRNKSITSDDPESIKSLQNSQSKTRIDSRKKHNRLTSGELP